MNTRKHIDIPNPCQKMQWADMDIAASGRHCAICEKTVVDFTTMDERQILEVLACGTKVCGNFTLQQLDQLNRADLYTSDSRSWWKKMAAAAVMLVASLPFFRSEAMVRPDVDLHFVKTSEPEGWAKRDTIKNITITGIVTDKDSDPLKGCVVRTEDKKFKTTTDSLGRFALTVPSDVKTVQVSSVGFELMEIKIDKKNDRPFKIKLKAESNIVGEVRVTRPVN